MWNRLTRFWRGPSGMREVLVLALPLMVSTLSWTVMHFTDRVFLLWYSADAVAAALPAGALSFAVMCFPLGLASYVNAFVSQYYGARAYDRIGLVVWQGVWVGLITIPAALATVPFAAAMFAGVGHPEQVAAYEVAFYSRISWGSGAMVVAEALSTFFTGRGGVRTVMMVDSSAALVNVVLDYALIFGNWGFPAWGVEGAATATAIALWFKASVYLALFLRKKYRVEFGTIAGCQFDAALFRRLLRFGSPSGVQLVCEVGAFTLFLLVVGRLGALELAATSLAFNVNSLAFMPVYGIGIATTTLVGQRIGQNRPRLAARGAWTAFALGAGYMLAVCVLYVFTPDLLLMAHGAKVDPADFEQLRALTVVLLRFVAGFCLFDAMVIVFSNAIKGAGDTRFVLITTLCMSPLPVLASLAGVELFGLGLYWSWTAITAWVCLLGVIYLARFQQGRWRTMRVIERGSAAVVGQRSESIVPTIDPATVGGEAA
jgi:MATE family multidrug resistance protein